MIIMTDKKKIMLVDDEPDITFGLRIGLEDNGFKVDAFNDPRLALSNFKPGSYDILLLDIRMPKMDGFELCQEIKKIDNKVKVCFMTAFDELYFEQFKKRFPMMDTGCFIRKPISIDDLAAEVNAKLSSSATKKAEIGDA
jgi:DNA-binding response OmpR family regulator